MFRNLLKVAKNTKLPILGVAFVTTSNISYYSESFKYDKYDLQPYKYNMKYINSPSMYNKTNNENTKNIKENTNNENDELKKSYYQMIAMKILIDVVIENIDFVINEIMKNEYIIHIKDIDNSKFKQSKEYDNFYEYLYYDYIKIEGEIINPLLRNYNISISPTGDGNDICISLSKKYIKS